LIHCWKQDLQTKTIDTEYYSIRKEMKWAIDSQLRTKGWNNSCFYLVL
jgi:hypothetical protein